MLTRTFRLTFDQAAPRDGSFGAVHTVDTDVLTECDGGLQVDTRVVGHVEGARVDGATSRFYPGVTMEKAAAYRIRLGYVEVPS
jgi:hypothetical protein